MRVATIIRRARTERKMSLRALAKAVRTDPAYLSRIECGKVQPSEEILRGISKHLGLAAEVLLVQAGKLPHELQGRLLRGMKAPSDLTLQEEAPPCGEPRFFLPGKRAIEEPDFPFEHLSEIAEMESWRKELNRPIYHLHKWWAQRLGSVFRATILGAFSAAGTDIMKKFYEPVSLEKAVVFDPFLGSGTTVGEALKLGTRAIGRDINPVAVFAVQNVMRPHSRDEVNAAFRSIQSRVAEALRRYYQTKLADGTLAEVLYNFWVMVAECPACGHPVDLFSSYVFATNHHPDKKAAGYAVCPGCGNLDAINRHEEQHTCRKCRRPFDLNGGPADGAKAECPKCKRPFTIAQAFQRKGGPPGYRLYAKLVLKPDGTKEYLPATECDRELFEQAKAELAKGKHPFPVMRLASGHNTDQAINYGFTHWHQFFNERQLLCLSVLAQAIRAVENPGIRELFFCLLSGCLEFNNMFASYKGEGTGAVRHMFSHHILKPERTPLEANLWGTPKSSGAFSTLFESRLLRALEYKCDPFEIRPTTRRGRPSSEKVYGLNRPLKAASARDFSDFQNGKCLYLSCGDSANTDVRTGSVDAVITDPPFFDNVHYSELADFFYAWQAFFNNGMKSQPDLTTRSEREVQHTDAAVFTERLGGVWKECRRVLRDDGLLVFSYHHSRRDGWSSVLRALSGAGFRIVATHPIKAEMSVAAPKQQAKEPIDVDILMVCRKVLQDSGTTVRPARLMLEMARQATSEQVRRFNDCGRELGRGDIRVIFNASLIRVISEAGAAGTAGPMLEKLQDNAESELAEIHRQQVIKAPQVDNEPAILELALA